jgi:diguanylate cyclase (GGDEF)-like protein
MIVLFISTYLCINRYIKSKGVDRKKYRMLLIASVLPYVSLIAILIDAGATGLDYSALIVPLSALFIMAAIAKYDFLELKSLSRKIVFENNPDSIVVVDNELNVVDYNREAIKFFNTEGVKIRFASLDSIISKGRELLSIMTGHDEINEYFAINGKTYEIISNAVHDDHGYLMGYYKTIRDITDKKNRQDRAEYLAKTDVLSGLNNRREFLRLAEEYFLDCRSGGGKGMAALMMDIDDFKRLNDTYGHAAGDDAIRIIGKTMKDIFPPECVLGRIGGEEFTVLIRNLDSKSAFSIAETFRRKIESAVLPCEDSVIKFTISIGLAICAGEYNNVSELLDAADKAMYISKKSGKNITTIAEKKK